MTNLPVKTERVDQVSRAPAVLFAYRGDLGGAGCQGLREKFIRVADGKNHSDRAASERLAARSIKLAVSQPKLGASDRQAGDYSCGGVFQAVDYRGSECLLVEAESLRAVANGQPGRDRAGDSGGCWAHS